ncbi:hypothetical protein A3B36_01235 [Candidatus Uhrbacteria bacterium RIFCSPLOWO2_01_FULL_55_36]|uniref:Uncharacterized protein n=1 Tax=Candidatus Uhrbacteria bacterium RIFCSPLOWO2_01_FULL_55_36 TaxID=1802404 RepID=A0A1F7UZF9_9BACT|nr:MAG: hypothetical protein A3B36_01235 [Candidatus Uhrbacteria bacterium RIFCSPLOWO2_01_FULL_55_36]
MNTLKNKMPGGVWALAVGLTIAGCALLLVSRNAWRMAGGGGWAWGAACAGAALIATAMGVMRRKWWGWLLVVIETVAAIAWGIVGVTYAALSLPAEWGRGWLAGCIAAALIAFAALIALLIALAQARPYFKDRDHQWQAEKWSRTMAASVVAAGAASLLLIGGAVMRVQRLGALPHAEDALAQAIRYCDSLGAGTDKDSCYVQIAVAAAEQRAALPDDFCARVSMSEPQLKFLCVAYARQIESCDAFAVARERALCRGLTSGNAGECGSLEASEREVCVSTVAGYLETLRNEQVSE